MPTELLSPGMPWTLVTNRVYALPAVKTTLFTDATAPALEVSNTFDFSIKAAITPVAGQATVVGGFIRATSGTPIIQLSRD